MLLFLFSTSRPNTSLLFLNSSSPSTSVLVVGGQPPRSSNNVMRSEFRSWDDALLAGRRRSRTLFRRKREVDVGGSEQFRNRLFDLQNTETVGERGDPIGDEHATGTWRAPTPRRQLITDESIAWATSLPVKRSGPLSSDIASDNYLTDHSRKIRSLFYITRI